MMLDKNVYLWVHNELELCLNFILFTGVFFCFFYFSYTIGP